MLYLTPKASKANSSIVLLSSNRRSSNSESLFPIPKFADFGLATITDTERRKESRAKALQRGTGNWIAPEQRVLQMKDPSKYFFETDSDDPDDDECPPFRPRPRNRHRICSEENICAVGAIMWTLVTLRSINDLGKTVNRLLKGDQDAHLEFAGTNVIRDFDSDMKKRYSNALLELIQKCTRLRSWDRPSGRPLLENLEAQMQVVKGEVEASTLKGDEDHHMVFPRATNSTVFQKETRIWQRKMNDFGQRLQTTWSGSLRNLNYPVHLPRQSS